MFIFAGRTLGTLAALLCAGIVAFALGGCASPHGVAAGACPEARAQMCVSYGPRADDVRCGCDDPAALEAALERMGRH
jgi:hypothetical protein